MFKYFQVLSKFFHKEEYNPQNYLNKGKTCKMGMKAPPTLWIRTASLAGKCPSAWSVTQKFLSYQSEL